MSTPTSSAEWARFYLAHGAIPIPVPFRQKAPNLKGWPDLRVTPETIDRYFNGTPTNIGLNLGASGLVDADLDCEEAVELAGQFLPPTPCRFGREGTGVAHWLWRIPTPLKLRQFQDVEQTADGERRMLLECRSAGMQTLAPGSVHPSGEPILFVAGAERFEPAAHADGAGLVRRLRLLATAALLARHWPAPGGRHQTALAAAGLLARLGLPLEDAVLVIVSAARVGGDEEAPDRRRDVETTYEQYAAGRRLVGGPTLAEQLRGDGAAVVAQLKRWYLAPDEAGEPAWHPPTDRPRIDIAALGLAEMRRAAWQAIEAANDPPRVYRFGSGLAWLGADAGGRPQIALMGEEAVRHHLANVATFIRWTPSRSGRPAQPRPAFPPAALAVDLLVVLVATLPRLQRLVHTPVFLADGRRLTTPGYDAGSGLYYAPPADLRVPPIPDAPTRAEIAAACALLLEECCGDFPFYGAADRAHALALLLTPFVRELIPGNTPLVVISKPTPRTGAGLLVKVLSRIQTGAPVPARTLTRDEEENRKRLTSFLLPAPALILLDNLHGRLDSPSLAAILTSYPTWTDRVLGKTQQIEVPVTATFVVTGNNVTLSNEMTGRAVLIRLDPQVEDPGTRTGFRHDRLEAWTTAHRNTLLGAVLTLGQAWVAAGMPPRQAGPTFGGFDEWADVLGGVLEVAGVEGFLANRDALYAGTDEDTGVIKGFLGDWWALYGPTPVLTRQLLETARNHPLDISAKNDQGALVRLGRVIGELVDRPYALETTTVRVRRRKGRTGGTVWHLDPA